MTLSLDCDICGEPVVLSRRRYVQLVKAGERPRCRKNGCERLCGPQNLRTSRGAEVLAVAAVPLLVVTWPAKKRGNANGALAKLAVNRDQQWRYEAGRDNG